MARITWREEAVSDLEEIERFIARDSRSYARILIARIVDATARLEELPLSGRIVPELSSEEIREVIISSYRVVYRLSGDTVDIVAVIHGARIMPPPPE